MTEFEIASVSIGKATLWTTLAFVATTLMIGLGQIAIIWYGIRAMNQSSAARAQDRKQQADAQEQRHAETMAELAMQRQALDMLIRQSDAGAAALRLLVERTALKGDPP